VYIAVHFCYIEVYHILLVPKCLSLQLICTIFWWMKINYTQMWRLLSIWLWPNTALYNAYLSCFVLVDFRI